jgi:hypothetical protein
MLEAMYVTEDNAASLLSNPVHRFMSTACHATLLQMGFTSLHRAARSRHYDFARVLLMDPRIDLDAKDNVRLWLHLLAPPSVVEHYRLSSL